MNIRRFAWIMMLSAGALLLLTYFMQQRQQTSHPQATTQVAPPSSQGSAPASQAATRTATQPGAALTEAPAPVRNPWSFRRGPVEQTALGSTDPASGYHLQVGLSTLGAGVHDVRLADHFATVADRKLFDKLGRNEQAYEQTVAAEPLKYHGHYSLVRPLEAAGGSYLPYATGRLTIGTTAFDLARVPWEPAPAPASRPADGAVRTAGFVWTLYRDANAHDASRPQAFAPMFRLTKTYTVRKGRYSVEMSIKAENLGDVPLKVCLEQYGPTGLTREDARQDMRSVVLGEVTDESKVNVLVEPDTKTEKMALGAPSGPTAGDAFIGRSDRGAWVGMTNKYFASMICPVPATQSLLDADYMARFYMLRIGSADTPLPAFTIGAKYARLGDGWGPLAEMEILPAKPQTIDFDIFAGPKKRDLFLENPLYQRLNYLSTIQFGQSCPCAWDWLALAMVWLLNKFAWIMLGNYGLAIMLLVVLTRLVLHPLTKKSQVSMMKMQKLAPKMAELKQKYADDKDTLQREMMKVYKEQGATPLLGCLPMLLQMPIWIALWSALSAAVELRHAAFLPVWLTDLAAPDAVISFPALNIPLIGALVGPIHALNLLPLLLTVAMYYQTKLNPQSAGPTTPEQASQQKMMRIMMPVMMLLFFYNAPSGLTLYIMTSTAAGVIEQMVIKKHIQQREAQAALAETQVSVPGKGPRSARPKKPKGPFWFKR